MRGWTAALCALPVLVVTAAVADSRYQELHDYAETVYQQEAARCQPLTGERQQSCLSAAQDKRERIEADAVAHRRAALERQRAEHYRTAARECRKLQESQRRDCEQQARDHYENNP